MGGAASLIPAIATALGLTLGPVGVITSVLFAGALGNLVGSLASRNSLEVIKVPKSGGLDTAIAILSIGYSTLATILAESTGQIQTEDSFSYFERIYRQHNDVKIREIFNNEDRDKIEKATEGDWALVARLLDRDKLSQIFVRGTNKLLNKSK